MSWIMVSHVKFKLMSFTQDKETNQAINSQEFLTAPEISKLFGQNKEKYQRHKEIIENFKKTVGKIREDAKSDPHSLYLSQDFSEDFPIISWVESQKMFMRRKTAVLHGTIFIYQDFIGFLYTGGDFKGHYPEICFKAMEWCQNYVENRFNVNITRIYRECDNAASQYKAGRPFQLALKYTHEMSVELIQINGPPSHGRGPNDSMCGTGFKGLCSTAVLSGKEVINSFSEACDYVARKCETSKKPKAKFFQIFNQSEIDEMTKFYRDLKDTNTKETRKMMREISYAGISSDYMFSINAKGILKSNGKSRDFWKIRSKTAVSVDDENYPWKENSVRILDGTIETDKNCYVYKKLNSN